MSGAPRFQQGVNNSLFAIRLLSADHDPIGFGMEIVKGFDKFGIKVDTLIEILDYKAEHQPWFEKFNRDWIEKYFAMEPLDYRILQDPGEHIIRKGGSIFMASYGKELAGTVALKFVSPGVYELTKMAVDEKFQGKKIGYALAGAAVSKAKAEGAERIFLYSNTTLHPAIALYRKLGFREIPVDGPYQRTNIKMELILR